MNECFTVVTYLSPRKTTFVIILLIARLRTTLRQTDFSRPPFLIPWIVWLELSSDSRSQMIALSVGTGGVEEPTPQICGPTELATPARLVVVVADSS